MTPHLNRLVETVQKRGHHLCFYAELIKIIPNYPQILPLIKSSEKHLKSSQNYHQAPFKHYYETQNKKIVVIEYLVWHRLSESYILHINCCIKI